MATWVGLDVTRRVRLTRRDAERMAADPHPFTAFAGRYSVAWIDHLMATGNARIATDVDPTGFAAHLTSCLRRL